MIDPFNITKFDRTHEELEEFALFAVAVAGHNAVTTAACLQRFLGPHEVFSMTPFAVVRTFASEEKLGRFLQGCGIGNWKSKARAFRELADSGLDLKTCGTHELEELHGWGRKTSRFFLLHSQEGFRGAALDTHILKYLSATFPELPVPKVSPANAKRYRQLELAFLSTVPPWMGVAEWDLEVWKRHARAPVTVSRTPKVRVVRERRGRTKAQLAKLDALETKGVSEASV